MNYTMHDLQKLNRELFYGWRFAVCAFVFVGCSLVWGFSVWGLLHTILVEHRFEDYHFGLIYTSVLASAGALISGAELAPNMYFSFTRGEIRFAN